MPTIDPKYIFYLSIAAAICGLGGNVAFWTGALPAAIIPILVKWNVIFSSTWQVVLPFLLAPGQTIQGRLAGVQPVPLAQKMDSLVANNPNEVKAIVTTAALANETQSDKIVSTK